MVYIKIFTLIIAVIASPCLLLFAVKLRQQVKHVGVWTPLSGWWCFLAFEQQSQTVVCSKFVRTFPILSVYIDFLCPTALFQSTKHTCFKVYNPPANTFNNLKCRCSSLKNHQFQLVIIFAHIKSVLYSFGMATIDQCLEYIKIYIIRLGTVHYPLLLLLFIYSYG